MSNKKDANYWEHEAGIRRGRIAELEAENLRLMTEQLGHPRYKKRIAELEAQSQARQAIANELQYWVNYVTKDRAAEGLETVDDTAIISPPSWPSVGMLKKWIEVIAPTPTPHRGQVWADCPGNNGKGEPCCDRAGEYNGFGSNGPLEFICGKSCTCHD